MEKKKRKVAVKKKLKKRKGMENCQSIGWLDGSRSAVGRLVGWSVIISSFTVHALIGALI